MLGGCWICKFNPQALHISPIFFHLSRRLESGFVAKLPLVVVSCAITYNMISYSERAFCYNLDENSRLKEPGGMNSGEDSELIFSTIERYVRERLIPMEPVVEETDAVPADIIDETVVEIWVIILERFIKIGKELIGSYSHLKAIAESLAEFQF